MEKCEEMSAGEQQQQVRRSKVRMRRTLSSGRAEDIVTAEQKARQLQHDRPVHSPCDSLLSWSSSFTKYEGMFNWGALLLFLSSVRVFLENLLKYGIRVSPAGWVKFISGGESDNSQFPVLYLLSFPLIPIFHTLLIERFLANSFLDWSTGLALHVLNLGVTLVFPIVIINTMDCALVSSILACGAYTILVLKLVSYIQVNSWCRHMSRRRFLINSHMTNNGDFFWRERMKTVMNIKEARKVEEPEMTSSSSLTVNWPDNLTVKDLSYFMLAPTLCYELNFPKTDRIRKFFLLRRGLEVILGTNLCLALIQQWIVPNVIHSLVPFHSLNWGLTIERLLKLALPNHIIWLIFFYIYFHSFLNTVGELLRFGDRAFYHDWWNSPNLSSFWQNWNLPVHKWCSRHLYKPLLQNGFSKQFASSTVFFLSAILHEYLLSVPLKMFKPWAFLGMFGQIPLIILSRKAEKMFGSQLGNLVMWASLILGHPLAIMMYYHDYVIENYGPSLIQKFGQLQSSSL